MLAFSQNANIGSNSLYDLVDFDIISIGATRADLSNRAISVVDYYDIENSPKKVPYAVLGYKQYVRFELWLIG